MYNDEKTELEIIGKRALIVLILFVIGVGLYEFLTKVNF